MSESPISKANVEILPSKQNVSLVLPAKLEKDFEMINESQDLPAIGDEVSTEPSTPQPAVSISTLEPQTRREPPGELMEDGSSQESVQGKVSGLLTNNKVEESQTRRELRSELMEDKTLQGPIQVSAINYIQEESDKTSDESQSMDYEFLENLFEKRLLENVNTQ